MRALLTLILTLTTVSINCQDLTINITPSGVGGGLMLRTGNLILSFSDNNFTYNFDFEDYSENFNVSSVGVGYSKILYCCNSIDMIVTYNKVKSKNKQHLISDSKKKISIVVGTHCHISNRVIGTLHYDINNNVANIGVGLRLK